MVSCNWFRQCVCGSNCRGLEEPPNRLREVFCNGWHYTRAAPSTLVRMYWQHRQMRLAVTEPFRSHLAASLVG